MKIREIVIRIRDEELNEKQARELDPSLYYRYRNDVRDAIKDKMEEKKKSNNRQVEVIVYSYLQGYSDIIEKAEQ